MVLIGLLLVALVCLALGLVLASAGWLVASLAVTAIAAYVMWSKRHEIAAPAPVKPAEAVATGAAVHESDPADTAAVDTDYLQRRSAWFAEGTAEGDVWVIDGQPNYHAADCGLLIGQNAEPVPFAQATEDGFTACAACDPDATVTAAPPVEPAPPASVDDVWVVDGQPTYHQLGCARLVDSDAEAIPLEQASEDGFTPCPQCSPADRPEPEPAPPIRPVPAPTPQAVTARDGGRTEVWVVDGRPRFHRSDCMIIKGQDAEAIPVDQATEDGFMPCSLCEPSVVAR